MNTIKAADEEGCRGGLLMTFADYIAELDTELEAKYGRDQRAEQDALELVLSHGVRKQIQLEDDPSAYDPRLGEG